MNAISEPIRLELPTMFAMGTVNSFLFLEPEPTLVDCGENSPRVWQALEKSLAAYQLSLQDIKRVIITHAHVDHIGMAGRIAREVGAKVWVSELVKPWALNPKAQWGNREDFIRETWLKGGASEAIAERIVQGMAIIPQHWEQVPENRLECFGSEGSLEIGRKKWQVLPAPGHSISQSCFYQPEQQHLLSADMLMYVTPTPVIEPDPETGKRVKGLPIMLTSYQKFAKLDVSKIFPGHGEVFQDAQSLIQQQVQRIEYRKNECLAQIEKGDKTVFELVQLLYKDANPNLIFAAFAMTLGYLDLLINEKQINRYESRNLWYFTVA